MQCIPFAPGFKHGHYGLRKSKFGLTRGSGKAGSPLPARSTFPPEMLCLPQTTGSPGPRKARPEDMQELGVNGMSKFSVLSAGLGLLAPAALFPAGSPQGAKDAVPKFQPAGQDRSGGGR